MEKFSLTKAGKIINDCMNLDTELGSSFKWKQIL